MNVVNIIFNILTSGMPACILALGVFLTFRLLDFADMTAEGSFLTGGAIAIAMINAGINPFLATLCGMLGGACCGFITGTLHTKLGIPKLLSGIITMTATTSIALLILGTGKEGSFFGNNITLSTDAVTIYSMFYNIDAPQFNSMIRAAVMLIVVLLVFLVAYYFFGTEYGAAIRATGMNGRMARAQGINTNISTIAAVSISNALIGLAGALFVQEQRSCDIKSASGFLVIGLASILIGEAIFGKRSFKNWLISVGLGAIIYFTIVTLAIEFGLDTNLKYLLYAILITLALCLPLIKGKGKELLDKFKEKKEAN